jgi:O-glycosyl hydrolase
MRKTLSLLGIVAVFAAAITIALAGCGALDDKAVQVDSWHGLWVPSSENTAEKGVTATLYPSFKGKSDVLKIAVAEGYSKYPWAPVRFDMGDYKGKEVTVTASMKVWLDASAKVAWNGNFKVGESVYPLFFGDSGKGQAKDKWVTISDTQTLSVPQQNSASSDYLCIYLSDDATYGLNGKTIYLADFSMTVKEIVADEGTEPIIPTDPDVLWRSTAYQNNPLGSQNAYAEGTGVVTIALTDTRQTIDGFGGSDAWKNDTTKSDFDTVVKKLYGKTDGIGFTILRNRIPFRERLSGDKEPSWNDGFVVRNDDNTYQTTANSNGTKTFTLNWNNWDIAATKTLIAKIKALADTPESLKLMSTPWTPPNNSVTQWKAGVSNWREPDVGGSLKPTHYEDYADLLADYALGFKSKMGADLTILSLQNEPHASYGYEGCIWNGDQFKTFAAVLGARFKLKGVQTGLGIMAAEDENMKEELVVASLRDPLAESVLTHVAAHQYEANWAGDEGQWGAEPFPETAAKGKIIWETEMGQTNTGRGIPNTNDITNGLAYAKMIHHDMTLTETSAWLYWWLWQYSDSQSDALIYVDNGTITYAKRYYTIGQFSKFVRPGYTRVGATTSPATNVYTSAYKKDSNIVIVLINSGSSSQDVTLSGVTLGSGAKIYRTSATEDLQEVSGALSGGTITLTVNSVTTVVGTFQ